MSTIDKYKCTWNKEKDNHHVLTDKFFVDICAVHAFAKSQPDETFVYDPKKGQEHRKEVYKLAPYLKKIGLFDGKSRTRLFAAIYGSHFRVLHKGKKLIALGKAPTEHITKENFIRVVRELRSFLLLDGGHVVINVDGDAISNKSFFDVCPQAEGYQFLSKRVFAVWCGFEECQAFFKAEEKDEEIILRAKMVFPTTGISVKQPEQIPRDILLQARPPPLQTMLFKTISNQVKRGALNKWRKKAKKDAMAKTDDVWADVASPPLVPVVIDVSRYTYSDYLCAAEQLDEFLKVYPFKTITVKELKKYFFKDHPSAEEIVDSIGIELFCIEFHKKFTMIKTPAPCIHVSEPPDEKKRIEPIISDKPRWNNMMLGLLPHPGQPPGIPGINYWPPES